MGVTPDIRIGEEPRDELDCLDGSLTRHRIGRFVAHLEHNVCVPSNRPAKQCSRIYEVAWYNTAVGHTL